MPVTLHLSCAVSSDGYLDDRSPARAILSSPEDLEAVLALRAQMDMIVIGAETLRRDNPSLATRGDIHIAARKSAGLAPDPIKVVVTRSGRIPQNSMFFQTGVSEKIILSHTPTDAPGTVEVFNGDPIDAILRLAEQRGLSNVMIEGGAEMLNLALPRARWMRMAVSPTMLGAEGHAFFIPPIHAVQDLVIARQELFGETEVFFFDLLLSRARPIMAMAMELSERCPKSNTAFSVGCIGCNEEPFPMAEGYSRETGRKDHAEEAMLSKINAPPHTVICTLEPCLTRASKPTGCAERLVRAGVKRVIYAVAEDDTFTQQTGLAYLVDHGVEVIHMPGFENWFRTVNNAIYTKP